MKMRAHVFVITWSLLLGSSAVAGTNEHVLAAGGDKLVAPAELRTAVRAVWDAHPEVQAAYARLQAARARAVAAARPLYNPELEVEHEDADDDTTAAGVSLAIDWSGKRRARTSVGTAEAAAAEADLALKRQGVAIDWLKAWSSWEISEARAAQGLARIEVMQRFAQLAERQFRAGDITQLDRDLALLALAEAKSDQGELIAGQAEARRVLQSGTETPIDVATLPILPVSIPDSLSGSNVIDDLPEVRKARLDADAARAFVAVADRERRPDPVIALRGGEVETAEGSSEPLVGVSVSIPLPVRNSYKAEVSAASAEATAAEADAAAARYHARAKLEQTEHVYRTLSAIWQDPSTTAAPFAERSALLDRLWGAGEISATEYLTQVKQSIDTELAHQALRARLWEAWFDYLGASGQLEPWLGVTESEEKP